ncbi:TfoX/Sxy family transcriptional regulator of competence genes [Breznakia sp. PF5-3]|uniref:TfoX/Sxy family protein n=1 Tax=unclassified Breznakia TaxID=2623764 RepID=UPI002404EDD0|nr:MULTISPECIES: TfoX/Sxy family protein [unclassified Breznakia]MDL2276524.1 TfoX/Sxy family protein [Breznakia sp. OttesenSCG-928-G09]MDF9825795.1 TfoX/Sxy family transcriptional regulator of competence genes [Breznakia sp. PM6-1]MDF9836600.1 TfoX/Sxy family transcriptional regulator of competence genes [Breznakia sp. PF5-3]MDF9838850.1 TfoX/Sxy family transcriptional regulator of competence genes [Breznakia sp. PFB2-8]MDF9860876.1 TfoX/Sxy family transcriptional regulator of competence gene
MSSKLEFVEYVCEQMADAGVIEYKRMFGEYGVYCDKKYIGLICDDQLFLKKTKKAEALLDEVIEEIPYQGAKPHFLIENIENHQKLSEIVMATYKELPEPKPKRKKS